MGGEWKKLLLSQIYEFRSGISKSRSEFGSGYPFLSFKDVFYHSAVSHCLTERVNSTEIERQKYSIKRGDVFLTRTSETLHELGMSSVALHDIPNATFNGFTKRLRPKTPDTVFPEYARYYFRSPIFRIQVTSMSSMSTRASLNNEMLGRLYILIPPLPEQRAIAHILGTLDDKIELNRRMNETLEAMAQALFKSWFVDFDPVVVNALRAGNPIPDKFAKRAAHYRNILRQKHAPLPRGEGLGVREKLPPKLLAYARALRKNQTDAERLMWRLLRNRQFLGIKFRRQHPIEPYIVDFYAHELGLVIEIDGGHHAEPKQKAYDEKRTAFLQEKGLMVIRYWANDVLNETEAVLKDLYQRVVERKKQFPSPPAPLPGGEGSIFPEHILRLFPDRFVDSELGPIPEGWEATTIGAEFDLTMGQSPPGSTYNEKGQGLPFFQGRRDFGFRYPSNRVYCTAPMRIAHAGDTLVSVRAPVGDINMAYETCCVGRGVAAVRHKSGCRSYTYYSMHAIGEQFNSYESEGTVFGAITKNQFSSLLLIAPSLQMVSLFEKLVYPLDETILLNEIESRTLAALRDTLLPKLISGELRVPDVEKILEDVV